MPADRVGLARDFARTHKCTLLLKGAPSIVSGTDGMVLIATTGSSDLATAGMGDQLSGTTGAFLAAGCNAPTAAALGLFYGGRAADLAEKGRGLSPLDVARLLPRALRNPGRKHPPFGFSFITFDQPPRH
jgi:NAD(P)H-hydrate epimerase